MDNKYSKILDDQGYPLTPDSYLESAYDEDGSVSIDRIQDLGIHYQQLAEESWEYVNQICNTYEPSLLLSGLSYLWLNMHRVGSNNKGFKNLAPYEHDVEFFQQLISMYISDPNFKQKPNFEMILHVNWHLRLLLRNVHIQCLVRVSQQESSDNFEDFLFAQFMQIQTRGNVSVTIRNLAFDDAVDLAGYFDFQWKTGMPGREIVEFMKNIGDDITEKVNEYLLSVNKKELKQTELTQELADCFQFDIEQLKKFIHTPISTTQIEALMKCLVLENQPFTFTDIEQVLLHRKARRYPFTQLPCKRYFCGCFDSLLLDPTLLVFEIASQNGLVTETVLKKIAANLENKIFQVFSRSLPSASVFSNVKWKIPGVDALYELDLLVYIDGYLLIVEAKSGQITDLARRGHESRLKRDVNKLVKNASKQVYRFVDNLPNIDIIKEMPNGLVEKIKVTSSNNIYGIVITQHQLGCLSRGLLPDISGKSIRAISIQELELVMDVMHCEAERLFYFLWRQQFLKYFVEEMSLIDSYLSSAFDSVEYSLEKGNGKWMLDYYYFKSGELDILPSRRFTPRWINILKDFDRQRKGGWLLVSFALLGFSYQDQLEFEQKLDSLRKRIIVEGANMKSPCMFEVIVTTSLDKKIAICPGIIVNAGPQERNQGMEVCADQVLQQTDVDRILIFGIQDEYNDPDFTSFMYVNR